MPPPTSKGEWRAATEVAKRNEILRIPLKDIYLGMICSACKLSTWHLLKMMLMVYYHCGILNVHTHWHVELDSLSLVVVPDFKRYLF